MKVEANKVSTRSIGLYIALFALWVLICGWMFAEHQRLDHDEREKLLTRAHDISSTVGVVIRSQGRFGIIPQPHLDAILQELNTLSELKTVALINSAGEVVSELGEPMEIDINSDILSRDGSYWQEDGVLVVNVVDFGPNTRDDGTTRPATILIREEDIATSDTASAEEDDEGRDWGRRGPPPPQDESGQNTETRNNNFPPPPPPDDDSNPERRRGRKFWHDFRRFVRNASGEDWDRLRQKRGLYGLALRISTESLEQTLRSDGLMRFGLSAFSLAAMLGLGVAWRNFEKTNQLQLRLVRLDELNNHLQEMNIASAGLAHETRNPLNIIRGIAQTVSKELEPDAEARIKLQQIVAEADRVAGRLNEFINYSKPLEPKLSPVRLSQIVEDVRRTLEADLEEKSIVLSIDGADFTVEADEMHLRQALFNLMLNAIQATPENGEVRVAWQSAGGRAQVEVADNGSGVDPSIVSTLFKPYVTTREDGTGLGLAIVRQIALAHHWDAVHQANQPNGAIFRLQGMKIIG
ncbi:hypothetical protein JXA32_14730 [Candidatus Sumerlaeota bacterium]|nr:hypothetical protein [Candidatus Sumerlaeota bacterium]